MHLPRRLAVIQAEPLAFTATLPFVLKKKNALPRDPAGKEGKAHQTALRRPISIPLWKHNGRHDKANTFFFPPSSHSLYTTIIWRSTSRTAPTLLLAVAPVFAHQTVGTITE